MYVAQFDLLLGWLLVDLKCYSYDDSLILLGIFFMLVLKHGGGQVFKTLQCLVQSLDTESISVGAIVAEDESRASRHLRLCASERKIPMMVSTCYYHCRIKLTDMMREYIYIYILRWSCLLIFSSIFNLMSPFQFECLMQPASWIINSLHLGRLLPLTENKHSSPLTRIMVQELPTSMEFSAEIWNLLPLYLATRFVH